MNSINEPHIVTAENPVGNIRTVNGIVVIKNKGKAGDIQTVTGSVTTESDTQMSSVGTTSGAIVLGERAKVRGDVMTASSPVSILAGATIEGSVQSAAGTIVIDSAIVKKGIKGGGLEISRLQENPLSMVELPTVKRWRAC